MSSYSEVNVSPLVNEIKNMMEHLIISGIRKVVEDINKETKEQSNHKEKEIIIFKNEKKIKISNRSLLLIK
jgi:hypothetical protein